MVQQFWTNTFYKFYIFITQIMNHQKLILNFINVSLTFKVHCCIFEGMIPLLWLTLQNITYFNLNGLAVISVYIKSVPILYMYLYTCTFVYIANFLILGMWISLNARKLKVVIINETTVTVVYFKIEISFLGFSRLKHAHCHR